MSIPPLCLPDFPTVGPTGARDNIERLALVHAALLPPGRVLFVDVAHDDSCPCDTAGAALSACTCDTVDVTLRLHDPRAS